MSRIFVVFGVVEDPCNNRKERPVTHTVYKTSEEAFKVARIYYDRWKKYAEKVILSSDIIFNEDEESHSYEIIMPDGIVYTYYVKEFEEVKE